MFSVVLLQGSSSRSSGGDVGRHAIKGQIKSGERRRAKEVTRRGETEPITTIKGGDSRREHTYESTTVLVASSSGMAQERYRYLHNHIRRVRCLQR